MRRLPCLLALLLLPSAAFAAPIVNGFDAGLEGWTVSGDNTFQWQPAGGLPGGCLDVNDLAVGLMNRALAPTPWLGDWSALGAGDTLSVDVFQQLLSGTVVLPPEMFVLEGPGGRATAIPSPSPANGTWTHFAVSLSPADWTVTSGSWAALLADVQSVQVSAEFVSGQEETRLDNLYLSEAPLAVARTCVLSLLDGGSEDWNLQNTGQVALPATGGDGGGFVQFPDAAGLSYAYAGSRFRGDWRPFENAGKVGVSLRQLAAGTVPLGTVEFIRLSGPGGTAHVPLAAADLPPAPRLWKRFEFPIVESAWTVTSGTWDGLLADVAEVRLQLEFWDGSETIGFDRFTRTMPGCDDGAPRPVLHVPDVTACGHVSMVGIRSTSVDPTTGRLAGVVDSSSTTGGLWWLTGPQAGTRFQAYAEASHAMFAANGDVFTSDDLNGIVYRRTAAGVSQAWATGFHAGDDDPLGLCVAPAGFSGPAVQPGDILTSDSGYNGPDEIWAFSAAAAETDVQLYASPVVRWMFDLAAGPGVVFVADSSMADRRLVLSGDGTVQEVPIAPPIPAMTSVVHDADGGYLYVVADREQGVHRISLATGATERVASGFRALGPAALELDPATRTLWVPDKGAGVTYRLCLAGTLDVPRAGPPRGDALELAVHPNPAQGGQQIAFTLPAGAWTSVEVFDLQGRLVRALDRGARTAGVQRVGWDGRGADGRLVAPGLYRVRVRAGGLQSSRTVVRIR